MTAKISRKRKNELMRTALAYTGQLLRQLVDSYEAFDELPEHERAFIDEYIVSIGDRLFHQAEQRDDRGRTAAQRILLRLDKS